MEHETKLTVTNNGQSICDFINAVGKIHEERPIVTLRGVWDKEMHFGGDGENISQFAESLKQAGFTTRIEPGSMG